MTNKEIRVKAKLLFHGNIKVFLLAIVPILVINILLPRICRTIITGEVLSSFITLIVNILLYPIARIGIAFICLSAWQNKKPRFPMLFWCFETKERILAALTVGLLCGFLSEGPNLIISVGKYFLQGWLSESLVSILVLVASAIPLLISLGLTIVPYMFVENENGKPFDIIKTGFTLMYRSIGIYLKLILPILGQFLLSFLVIIIIVTFVCTLTGQSTPSTDIMSPVFILLLSPLVIRGHLVTAWLAKEIVPANSRKKENEHSGNKQHRTKKA